MKSRICRNLFGYFLFTTVCLFLEAGVSFALDLPMNVTERSNGGIPNTKFELYMTEEAVEGRYDYYHVWPEEVADKDHEAYLKLELDGPTQIWTDLIKVNPASGALSFELLAADKKTVITRRNLHYHFLENTDEIIFRGVLPAGTYYFYFHDSIEGDCIASTWYWLQVPEFNRLTADDDKVQPNNTKDTAAHIEEDEKVSGFLSYLGTDPADWYTFTVTEDKGILDYYCAEDGVRTVLLRSDGTRVEEGCDMVYSKKLDLIPDTYYLGIEYVGDDDPESLQMRGGVYTISFKQEKNLTGLALSSEEIIMDLNDTKVIGSEVVPEGARGVTVAWSSSDESVVTVDNYQTSSASPYNNTTIRSKDKNGSAVITVKTTDGSNLSASCKVTVKEGSQWDYLHEAANTAPVIPDTSNWYIRFDNNQLTLDPGQQAYISFRYSAPEKPVWVSSDEEVVSADGWSVTAKKPGKATITASFESAPLVKAECEVTVNGSSDPSTEEDAKEDNKTDEPAETQKTVTITQTVKAGAVLSNSSAAYKVEKGLKTVSYRAPRKKTVKSVVVPAAVKLGGKTYKVTGISANAFKGCSKLTSVTIGKNVTAIGKNAFYNCKKLKKISIKTSVLKKIGANAFKGIYAKACFKVPKKKVKAYKTLLKKKGIGKKTVIR